jgi:lipopolysaccharide exporter
MDITTRSHVWQSLANYLQTGGGILIGIILARILHPEDFGIFGMAIAVSTACFLPTNWSLSQVLVADGGRTPHLFEDALHFAWRIVFLKWVLITAVIFWLAMRGGSGFLAALLFYGYPAALYDVVSVHRAACEGARKYFSNTASAVLTLSISAGLSVPLALSGWGPLALSMPTVVLALGQMVLYSRAAGQPLWLAPHRIQTSLQASALPLWILTSSDQAIMRLDKLVFGALHGDFALGNYSRAFNYAPISHQIFLSLVTSPAVSAFAAASAPYTRRQLLVRSASIILGAGLAAWVAILFMAKPLVPLVFGEQWRNAVPYFEAFAGLGFALSAAALPRAVLLSRKAYWPLAAIEAIFACIILCTFVAALVKQAPLVAPHILVWGLVAKSIALSVAAFVRHPMNDTRED